MQDIYGEKIILKTLSELDSEDLFKVVGDPDVTEYMSMDPFPSKEFTSECIKRWAAKNGKDDDFVYGIYEKNSKKLAGLINTCGMHHGQPVIGYCLAKAFWGKGYMTEALSLFTDMLFAKGYKGIVIDAAAENHASNEVIRKNGFAYVGSFEEPLCDSKPEPVLTNDYRLLAASKVRDGIRLTESKLDALMSVNESFSEHMVRMRDDELPDMYDLNSFVYDDIPDETEIDQAISYQVKKGDDFFQMVGERALSTKTCKKFELEESCELTMMLASQNPKEWTKNTKLQFKDLKADDIESDLLELELSLYGSDYGEDFTKRKMLHWIDAAKKDKGLNFYAAYLDGKIVGSLFSYSFGEYVMMDGLMVAEDVRNQYIATSLLAHCIENEGKIAFLHADADDTPKEMYIKLGFRLEDYKYYYFKNLSE